MSTKFPKKALVYISAFLLTAILFPACFNDDVPPENPQMRERDVSVKSMTAIVGAKLKNPYSLRNMIQAESAFKWTKLVRKV